MVGIISMSLIIVAIGLLVILSAIDLKTRLLPDFYNISFAFCAACFHAMTAFSILSFDDVVTGALIGGGFLYAVRFVANSIYKQDTLGLGDVKLLFGGGLWLGPQGVLLAITLGGIAGLIHGLTVLGIQKLKGHNTESLSHFSIPAGPGFAVGILAAGVFIYKDFMIGVFS